MKILTDKIESFSSPNGMPSSAILRKQSAPLVLPRVATVISWACAKGMPILVFGGNIYIYNGKYYSRGEPCPMFESLKKLSHPYAH